MAFPTVGVAAALMAAGWPIVATRAYAWRAGTRGPCAAVVRRARAKTPGSGSYDPARTAGAGTVRPGGERGHGEPYDPVRGAGGGIGSVVWTRRDGSGKLE
ncbi:hypothetical protein VT52_004345 [Streptomyces malaysiense]|uniref:Uncharacterized protein n=1 Tax=Streptomyces malaysiense TaxID=1428626 RepID=A0A1J4Q787_9ACTN|nr:hypothetical protein VT52_004345 [Streptomyces malaysiense]